MTDAGLTHEGRRKPEKGSEGEREEAWESGSGEARPPHLQMTHTGPRGERGLTQGSVQGVTHAA